MSDKPTYINDMKTIRALVHDFLALHQGFTFSAISLSNEMRKWYNLHVDWHDTSIALELETVLARDAGRNKDGSVNYYVPTDEELEKR